jgi:nicotinate-nucleotide--dimethylbenzimidazole phosphoribosyltransferase
MNVMDMRDDFAERSAEGKSFGALAQERLDSLAKPPGALGQLERLAVRLCAAAGSLAPETRPRTLVVFAGDHGSVSSGVSLWPQEVTVAVARTLLAGLGAASVMARTSGCAFWLADVGLAGPLPDHEDLIRCRVRSGTRNMEFGPALTVDEFSQALAAGADAANAAIADGARLLVAGEIGIGNTTAAAAITATVCGLNAEAVLGSGAGATPVVLDAKRRVIAAAVDRAREIADLKARLASVAGLEIAAMAGFYIEAARQGVPVVLDGAISGAAALMAVALESSASKTMIASHLSAEPCHLAALDHLDLDPLLRWDMRLGEGSGALALLPLLDMAADVIRNMATLSEALALSDG